MTSAGFAGVFLPPVGDQGQQDLNIRSGDKGGKLLVNAIEPRELTGHYRA